MHYINIIDRSRPDDFFMYMSSRINAFNIQRNNSWTLIKINEKELTEDVLSSFLSDYVWEIILPSFCSALLKGRADVIAEHRKDIVSATMNVAACMKNHSEDVVKEKFFEYLTNEYSFLTLDGFVLFRLKGLTDDIKTLLNIAVYEDFLEDEFKDFVDFMKELVSFQPTIHEEIFLLENETGFRILAENGFDITNDFSDNNNLFKGNFGVSGFDSIISSVISIAPKKIYIHCSDEMFSSGFCELIKGIFSGRVIKC